MDFSFAIMDMGCDIWAISAGVLLCLATSWQVLALRERAAKEAWPRRMVWLGLAALTAGLGFWAAHLLATSGYRLAPHGDARQPAVLPVLVAVGGSGAGLALSLLRHFLPRATGAIVLAIAVLVMHVLGTTDPETPAILRWDQPQTAWRIVLGAGLAATALGAPMLRGRHAVRTVLLSLAVVTMHLGGMAGLPPAAPAMPGAPDPPLLHFWLALAVSAVVIAAGSAAMPSERQPAPHDPGEAQRLRHLAEAALEGLAIHENGVIRDANSSFARLVGLPREELLGRRLDAFLPRARLARTAGRPVEDALVRPTGQAIPVEILGRPLRLGERPVQVLALRDLRVERAAEARIRHMARHDQLTGLPNRAALRAMLAQEVEKAGRADAGLALLLIDITGLRDINSLHGDAVGDRVLRETAARLEACVDGERVLGRLAGDEFAIVDPGIDGPQAAASLAETLRAAVTREPIALAAGVELTVAIRIGIALYPTDASEPIQLIARAAEALLAEEGVDDTIRFFDRQAEMRRRDRRDMLDGLRQALASGCLATHFQPQIDGATGRMVGCETLVRWEDPAHGTVPPGVFVPLAEEAGLAEALGAFVLRAGCKAAAAWPAGLPVAVNISAAHMATGRVPALVARVLAETGLAAERLELEITESVLMDDTPSVLATLERLRAMGVTIALDDFGTGYSSLAYLHTFPFDRLKIDRSFIRPIGRGGRGEAIVEAVLALARALDVTTVAEGVETETELDFLKARGCNEIQGFLVARPMSATDLAALLRSWPRGADGRPCWPGPAHRRGEPSDGRAGSAIGAHPERRTSCRRLAHAAAPSTCLAPTREP